MKYFPSLALSFLVWLPCHAEDDLLRFMKAGDQLHGVFGGFNESGEVVWTRQAGGSPLTVHRDEILQIALNHERRPLESPAYIELANGDRIPGTVEKYSPQQAEIQSPVLGNRSIPANQLRSIVPSPMGGRIISLGTFRPDGWKQLPLNNRKEQAEEAKEDKGENDKADKPAVRKEDEKAEDKANTGWQFTGAAWESQREAALLLVPYELPDRALIRFRIQWQQNLQIAIGLHATLAGEAPADKPQQERVGNFALGNVLGAARAITLQHTYPQLFRTSVTADPDRIESDNSGAMGTQSQNRNAELEIRTDRVTGLVMLFMNGRCIAQWIDNTKPELDGKRFGLINTAPNFPIRVSDLVIAEWNGLMDSARSMESETQDVVLLNNGMDRISGTISEIDHGKLQLRGNYANMEIPFADVSEIHFARQKVASEAKPRASDITIRYGTTGMITATPKGNKAEALTIDSPLLGALDIQLPQATLLEFRAENRILQNWNDEW